jgi:hypothetical protein
VTSKVTAAAAPAAHPLDYATVAGLLAMYRRREVSPVEVVRHQFERVARHESSLHCFVTQTPEVAMARAREAEAIWMRSDAHSIAPMLCGIPYGLKDVISTAGILTTGQSKILQYNVPSKDAAVEARMKGSGGVLMGKLTTYEFAHGGPSWDLPWPPAMNPWKPGYLPGSTSSGAVAAIAAGLGFGVQLIAGIGTLTTTGFGDVTLPGPLGKLLSIAIMLVGITLFLRLAQALIKPHKVRHPCDRCGLQTHDPDAVHCKACGNLICIPDEG